MDGAQFLPRQDANIQKASLFPCLLPLFSIFSPSSEDEKEVDGEMLTLL